MGHSNTPKFTIQSEKTSPCGPFHWKRIVEWYEFGLLDDFHFQKSSNASAPVSELVKAFGVPPSIGIQSILLAPSDDAAKCSAEQKDLLQSQGFPEISAPLTQELAAHLNKRLSLSDQALDQEDPDFKSPNPIHVSAAASGPEEIVGSAATPAEPDETETNEREPEAVVPETAEPEAMSSDELPPPSEKPTVVAKSDEVPETEAVEQGEAVQSPVEAEPESLVDMREEPLVPAAVSFEELADSKPEGGVAKPYTSSRAKSGNKPVVVIVSTIAATLVVAGAVYYTFSSKSPAEAVSSAASSDGGVPENGNADAQVPAKALVSGDSEPTGQALKEASAAVTGKPTNAVNTANVQSVNGRPMTDALKKAETGSGVDVPLPNNDESVVAESDFPEQPTRTEAFESPLASPLPEKEAEVSAGALVEDEVQSPFEEIAKVAEEPDGGITLAAENANDPSGNEAVKPDNEPILAPEVTEPDASFAQQVPLSQPESQSSPDTEPIASSRTSTQSSGAPANTTSANASDTSDQEELSQEKAFTPVAPIEEFPDYIPAF